MHSFLPGEAQQRAGNARPISRGGFRDDFSCLKCALAMPHSHEVVEVMVLDPQLL